MMRRNIMRSLVSFLISLGLSGCGEEEMVFFSSEATGATYEAELTEGDAQQSEPSLLVYVCGAVQEPGVVAVDADARIVDAICLAGGMTPEADETYVNLAARLTDGEKIYVPTRAEVIQWESANAVDSRININTADMTALCTLPGIGESKAAEIIAYREENGSFKTLEELMNIPGIKENLFEKIADKIKLE